MIQIYSKGFYLDLIQEEDISFTLEAEDIQDISSIRSNFTETFRLPATENNNNFFENYFEINSVDFDPTLKIEAFILFDGALWRTGQLRLETIFRNDASNVIEYEVFFIGEIGDLASQIGNGNLNELDLSDLSYTQNYQTIIQSWTYSLFNGDVVYGMYDLGQSYGGGAFANLEPRIIRSLATQDKPITNASFPYQIKQWRPSIRIKKLIDAIFAETEYTYTSNFLSGITPLSPTKDFLDLYMPAVGNNAVVSIDGEGFTQRALVNPISSPISFSVEGRINLKNIIDDEGNNIDIGQDMYVIPTDGNYKINGRAVGTMTINTGANFVIVRLYKNRGGVGETVLDAQQFLENFTGSATRSFDIPVEYIGAFVEGDYIQMTIEGIVITNGQYSTNNAIPLGTTHMRVQETPAIINNPASLLNNDYTKIDFIRDITKAFNLIIVPDKNNSKNLIIEPWNDYIATGEVRDWTNKIDLSTDAQISPIIYDQPKIRTFKLKEDQDHFNQLLQETFKRTWGEYKYISTSDVITEEETIELGFSGSPTGNQEDNPVTNFAPMVEFLKVEAGNKRTPIRPNPRIVFYQGLTASFWTWYIEDDASIAQSRTTYPQMVPFSELPTTDNSLHLSFVRDFNYGASFSATSGIGFYDKYWKDYIDSLYDKRAKIMTADFILDQTDIFDFEFKDVIFLKDSYWRVLNIEGLVPDKKVAASVSLIKLFNYSPEITTTTTTSTSTTTTTTTTTTSTTTLGPCETCSAYEMFNGDTEPVDVFYTDCNTQEITSIEINPSQTITICSCNEPEPVPPNILVEVLSEGPCEEE
jgi:hypothetical protein